MFNNIAFDVVIGLVFIYLLYSLLATVLVEIFATTIGLRARNLREAIDRMLNDYDDSDKGFWLRLLDSVNILKRPKSLMVKNFYNHPEIKYLGSTGIFKNPSSFKAYSFSKTIIYQLSGEGPADKTRIETRLFKLRDDPSTLKPGEITLDKETADYVLSLWYESYGDLVKFRLHLETWFDRTMEQALEWYKRKIQVVLTVLGFLMAWIFFADTFTIIKKLSTDKDAREKVVTMASAYVQNNQRPPEPSIATLDSNLKNKLDSLLEVKRKLDADIANANSILGLGGWLPDTVKISTDLSTGKRVFSPQVDGAALTYMRKNRSDQPYIRFSFGEKCIYFLWLFPLHFFGFLVTALAISLGAPFWFDLLNKLMKLRTSVKQSLNSSGQNPSGGISPLNREA